MIAVKKEPGHVDKIQIRGLAGAGHAWDPGLSEAKRPLIELSPIVNPDELEAVVRRIERDRTIHVTLASREYLNVGVNWSLAMRALKIENHLLIAGDEETRGVCVEMGIPHVRASLSLLSFDPSYRSPAGFSGKGLAMTALKFPVVKWLVGQGYNVTFSDADAIWLQDPSLHLPNSADIAFQRVAYFPTELSRIWGFAACTGFVFFRAGPGTSALLDRCIQEQTEVHSDQLSMNLAMFELDVCWRELIATPRRQRPGDDQEALRRRGPKSSPRTHRQTGAEPGCAPPSHLLATSLGARGTVRNGCLPSELSKE